MFELANPWVLLLIPIPFFIWFGCPPMKQAVVVALKIPFFQSIQPVVESYMQKIGHQMRVLSFFCIWCLLVVALAGPRWVGQPQSLSNQAYNIMLALDISLSMDVRDMSLHGQPASRLAIVKRAARQFIEDRPQDKLGLIVFGEKAYLLTPLTLDHINVIERLDDATPGLAGKETAVGDALGLAVKRLQKVPAQGRIIILLTDGVNNAGIISPLKAAELARDEGIRVYTIGLGASSDASTFDAMFLRMNGAGADLDETTLKSIAKMTGGRYFRATNPQTLQRIYALIHQLETVKQDGVVIRPQHDYYPWLLGMAWMVLAYELAKRARLLRKTL